jgi:hypothetical protein
MDECGSYSRDSNLDKFVKGFAFVDKVDFANKTLNQAGENRRYLSKRTRKTRKTKLFTVHPIIKLRCLTATYYTNKIIQVQERLSL